MRWPGGVARVVEKNDYRILAWKPEGKRAPQVYQLVCHIVWRRTEFRPTAVEARFSPSTPGSVHCSDL